MRTFDGTSVSQLGTTSLALKQLKSYAESFIFERTIVLLSLVDIIIYFYSHVIIRPMLLYRILLTTSTI